MLRLLLFPLVLNSDLLSLALRADAMSDSLSQKADSDGGSSSTEDKRSRSELSSPTDIRPPETYNRSVM